MTDDELTAALLRVFQIPKGQCTPGTKVQPVFICDGGGSWVPGNEVISGGCGGRGPGIIIAGGEGK